MINYLAHLFTSFCAFQIHKVLLVLKKSYTLSIKINIFSNIRILSLHSYSVSKVKRDKKK